MSHYDDIAGRDLPDIDDLISGREREEEQDFESFLSTTKLKEKTTWSGARAEGAEVSSGGSSTPADETVVGGLTSVVSATDQKLRDLLVTQKVQVSQSIAEAIRQTLPSEVYSHLKATHPQGDPLYIANGHHTSEPATIQPPTPILLPEPEAITHAAQVATQIENHLELRHHPILGSYVSESLVAVEVSDPDKDRYSKIYLNTHHLAVSEMKPEQIVDTIHTLTEELREQKFIKTTQIDALRSGLEELLGRMNQSDRASILERQKSYEARKSGKAPRPTKTTTPKDASIDPKLQKSIKAMKDGMGLLKEEMIKELTDRGKLTPEVSAYLDKVYA